MYWVRSSVYSIKLTVVTYKQTKQVCEYKHGGGGGRGSTVSAATVSPLRPGSGPSSSIWSRICSADRCSHADPPIVWPDPALKNNDT